MKKTIAAATIGAASLLTAGGLFLSSYTMNGTRQTLEEALQWQRDHYDLSWFDRLETESYLVPSYDGYELHCLLCRCPEESNRYVILTHGYTDNRYGALKYARLYLDKGFHCILYDLRGHGENAPTFCTYSIREGKDLYEIIKDSYSRYGAEITLGLHGESLGAASTIAALQYGPQVAFAVADCPFADIENVLRTRAPAPAVGWASLWAKLRYGYAFSEMRPIDALKNSQVPLLLLHGAADNFISPENSRRLYQAAQGPKELHLIPGAGHAQSVLTAPEEYAAIVHAFLEKLSMNQSE